MQNTIPAGNLLKKFNNIEQRKAKNLLKYSRELFRQFNSAINKSLEDFNLWIKEESYIDTMHDFDRIVSTIRDEYFTETDELVSHIKAYRGEGNKAILKEITSLLEKFNEGTLKSEALEEFDLITLHSNEQSTQAFFPSANSSVLNALHSRNPSSRFSCSSEESDGSTLSTSSRWSFLSSDDGNSDYVICCSR